MTDRRAFLKRIATAGIATAVAARGTIGSDGPWDMRRVLGTVPVKPDGSVKFQMLQASPLKSIW